MLLLLKIDSVILSVVIPSSGARSVNVVDAKLLKVIENEKDKWNSVTDGNKWNICIYCPLIQFMCKHTVGDKFDTSVNAWEIQLVCDIAINSILSWSFGESWTKYQVW